MALFIPGFTPCSLCGKPICVGHDIVGTTHFIVDVNDPFYVYSDTVMHRPCFDAWEHRDEFARRYRARMGPMYPQNEHYQHFPGPPGRSIVRESPPPPPPPPPEHFCPACQVPLSVAKQSECPHCGWLRYPSDRTRWSTAGPCPRCGFAYRFDGRNCSHCGQTG
jgi:hypothetical protein